MPDYHLLNTNKGHIQGDGDGTEIYDLGVAATFGTEEYGKKLKPISEGDIILSYVNGIGYRAVGRVSKEWSGEHVPEGEPQVGPEQSKEYHIDVDWERILPESEAIELGQANKHLAYSEDTPANFTRKTVKNPEAGKRLADAIRGRRGDEPNLFLVPAGRTSDNLNRTVTNPVPKATVRKHDTAVDLDRFQGDSVPVWGHQEEKPIEEGDILLLYKGGTYPYAAEVATTEYNPSLGQEIWVADDDESFEYIFYLINIQELDLDRRPLNAVLDYDLSFYPTGFMNPTESKLNRLRRKFGGVHDFVDRAAITEVPDTYRRIADQLEETNQVVFHGPPGTGKTHHAQEFAEWWLHENLETVQENRQSRFITFHPSFSYEDFVEGLTTKSQNGQVTYEMDRGVLREFVEEMSAWPNQENAGPEDFDESPRYVLIIDEINRGNIANILGELVTLLESDKREGEDNETTVNLAHSNEEFSLPSNLYIIGTMNTADRSITLVDAAIRRRFGFISFPPDYEFLADRFQLAETDLEDAAGKNNLDGLRAASILALKAINEVIRDRGDLGKGKQLGHSYLLGSESEADVVRAWKYQLLPLLEEYFFESFDDIRDVLDAEHAHYVLDLDHEQIRHVFGQGQDIEEAEALRTVLREVAEVES
ncbi:AAA family ATPase [Haloarcula sp. 1CSR25-25]|uniref:McrB family protein n=1 Tax=Haloarcula sp. 1CSR25-25 TaxID=2862545 RepID=UPI0028949A5C|nr:AAA family ATPase [Haloarcula sp. 1CSR25-25]MDT3434667.1 AAA family ATPase [Haloarcula sp. 1CSR25-25]